ncbi:MAG: Asp-tRNA(Asn)/Glu-tRNA(Gln) amidotransferase subunit GatB [Pseudomonadota bacterium]
MNQSGEHKLIKGKTGLWQVVIGLEVHAQIKSASKLFSTASTRFGASPNAQVSLVDAAMPGMLPVVNRACIEQAVRTGLALKGTVQKRSIFARKNYFYADLPQGYQISQYEEPLVLGGEVIIDREDGTPYTIRIERLHVEQDAGKSMHDQHPEKSCIDLNRSGIGLMEIVSKPDMRSGEEAALYVAKLQTILRTIGSCSGNMAEGAMRADINLSICRPGANFGTRTETKNVNSLRFIRQTVEYETKRQISVLESGGCIHQETRLFDPASGTTKPMRSKEDAHDYRYFPDPDLPPLLLEQHEINDLAAQLPELPDARRARFIKDFGLGLDHATQLVSDPAMADYFERAAGSDPKRAANWILSELLGRLHKAGLELSQTKIKAEHIAQLVDLVREGVLSGRMAKDVFDQMFENGLAPAEIVEQQGLRQIDDNDAVMKLIEQIIQDNPVQCQQYLEGKEAVLGWLVGQVMKASAGSANPQIAGKLLRTRLAALAEQQ